MEIAKTVKGKIEKTMLGQVSKSIMFVLKSDGASIVIKLDAEQINSSRLFIDARIVKDKILKSLIAPKDHEMEVKVVNDYKLAVKLKGKDIKGAYFPLHQLQNKLPMVIVKGISTVDRAIIADDEGKIGKLNLIVEGTGLREVMGIRGIKGCETESNHVME